MNRDHLQPGSYSECSPDELSSTLVEPCSAKTTLALPIRSNSRRKFHWSEDAIQLVAQHQERVEKREAPSEINHNSLVAKLEEISGNPRDACLRLLRRIGLAEKRSYHQWTKPEQQRLVDLIDSVPVKEAARILRRPPGSVRSMLRRLGLGARQSREWFSPSLLAQVLHVGRDEVRKWITRGWLQCRVVQAQSVNRQIIQADDFCEFIKKHGRDVVGNRLNYEGLAFVRDYVFPRPHADLLSVRGPYKKEPRGQSKTDERIMSEQDEIEENAEQSA